MKMPALIGWLLLVIIAAPTGVARADPTDDKFVAGLADQGITGDPNQLIAEGHTVCDDVEGSHLATNAPGWTNVPALGPVMGDLHLSLFQARFIINAAESAYCPQFLGLGHHGAERVDHEMGSASGNVHSPLRITSRG
jgi:hypothetical protein